MHGVEVDMTIWWVAYVTPPLKIPGYTPDKIIQKAFILAAVMMNSTQTSEYSDIIIFLFIYLFTKKIIITNTSTVLLSIQNNFLLSQQAENNMYKHIIKKKLNL